MKKNKMMRIASVLLIVTILSTVAISGTFAKYITTADGSDTARVAQWGITITTTGSMFNAEYDSEAIQGTKSVKAVVNATTQAQDMVVAPGTSKTGFEAKMQGTSEVTTKLYVDLGASQDIVVPAGDHEDYTTYPAGTFTSAADYSPVKFNIGFYGTIGNTTEGTAAQPIEFIPDAQDALEQYSGGALTTTPGVSLTEYNAFVAAQNGQTFQLLGQTFKVEDVNGRTCLTFTIPAGKYLDCTFKVDWAWAYEGDYYAIDAANSALVQIDAATVDKLDTYLGHNAMANELTYSFTAGAVQVD